MYLTIWVVGKADAEFVVDGAFVSWIGFGEHASDFPQSHDEGSDLVRCELCRPGFSPEFELYGAALSFHLGDPVGNDWEVLASLQNRSVAGELRPALLEAATQLELAALVVGDGFGDLGKRIARPIEVLIIE